MIRPLLALLLAFLLTLSLVASSVLVVCWQIPQERITLMKRIGLYTVLTILSLLAFVRPVMAQCSTSYSRSYYPSYTYYTPPVVKKYVDEIVYTRYIAVLPLLDLPTYSAYAHVAPAVAAPKAMAPASEPTASAPAASSEMQQVLALLKNQDARLTRLEAALGAVPPSTPAAPATAPKVGKLNTAKCVVCHSTATAAKDGGDFALFDLAGNVVRLDDGQIADLIQHVGRGTMPKINAVSRAAGITALTEEEAGAWMEEAGRQRNLNRMAAKK